MMQKPDLPLAVKFAEIKPLLQEGWKESELVNASALATLLDIPIRDVLKTYDSCKRLIKDTIYGL